jgi:hypothetical protein
MPLFAIIKDPGFFYQDVVDAIDFQKIANTLIISAPIISAPKNAV